LKVVPPVFLGKAVRLIGTSLPWGDFPDESLVWFEHSGHIPMTEEPGKFLLSLMHYAWPIAEKAGDVAP